MSALHSNDKNMLAANGVMLPLALGGVLFALAFVIALSSQGGALSRVAMPVLGMAMVGLLTRCWRCAPAPTSRPRKNSRAGPACRQGGEAGGPACAGRHGIRGPATAAAGDDWKTF